jgi:hypothetical protein
VEQIIAALILALGAFYGVWKGAIYAADRLAAQLAEERQLSDERLEAEGRRVQRQLDAEAARLDKQLEAETKRLEQQLESEADRLDKQLKHDRWMREVDELRRLIDEAASAGLMAGNAVHAFRGYVRYAEDNDTIGPGYIGARQQATEGVQGMQGFVERLELRLGPEHALPGGFSSWQVAMEEALAKLETTPPTKELLREAGEDLKESSARYLNFMGLAREYVQLEPPIDEIPF